MGSTVAQVLHQWHRYGGFLRWCSGSYSASAMERFREVTWCSRVNHGFLWCIWTWIEIGDRTINMVELTRREEWQRLFIGVWWSWHVQDTVVLCVSCHRSISIILGYAAVLFPLDINGMYPIPWVLYWADLSSEYHQQSWFVLMDSGWLLVYCVSRFWFPLVYYPV